MGLDIIMGRESRNEAREFFNRIKLALVAHYGNDMVRPLFLAESTSVVGIDTADGPRTRVEDERDLPLDQEGNLDTEGTWVFEDQSLDPTDVEALLAGASAIEMSFNPAEENEWS